MVCAGVWVCKECELGLALVARCRPQWPAITRTHRSRKLYSNVHTPAEMKKQG